MLKLVELSRGGPRSFSRTYLHRVAKSVLIDEIRRRRTRSEESFEGLASAELRSADARTPERLAHAGEIGGVIRASLDELARDRAAAVALHLQGFSVPETAQQLGWSRKRTENLVYRGLSDLRRKLRGRGVDPG